MDYNGWKHKKESLELQQTKSYLEGDLLSM